MIGLCSLLCGLMQECLIGCGIGCCVHVNLEINLEMILHLACVLEVGQREPHRVKLYDGEATGQQLGLSFQEDSLMTTTVLVRTAQSEHVRRIRALVWRSTWLFCACLLQSHPVSEALFNFVNTWSFVLLPLMVYDARGRKRIPLWIGAMVRSYFEIL